LRGSTYKARNGFARVGQGGKEEKRNPGGENGEVSKRKEGI